MHSQVFLFNTLNEPCPDHRYQHGRCVFTLPVGQCVREVFDTSDPLPQVRPEGLLPVHWARSFLLVVNLSERRRVTG